ncbi:hypothetical protein C8Q77DRAFT_640464 [Trametes polyzona]|nr:hypothetical protein C8Q77DRAFT_640464 [Trametes polyzona]
MLYQLLGRTTLTILDASDPCYRRAQTSATSASSSSRPVHTDRIGRARRRVSSETGRDALAGGQPDDLGARRRRPPTHGPAPTVACGCVARHGSGETRVSPLLKQKRFARGIGHGARGGATKPTEAAHASVLRRGKHRAISDIGCAGADAGRRWMFPRTRWPVGRVADGLQTSMFAEDAIEAIPGPVDEVYPLGQVRVHFEQLNIHLAASSVHAARREAQYNSN